MKFAGMLWKRYCDFKLLIHSLTYYSSLVMNHYFPLINYDAYLFYHSKFIKKCPICISRFKMQCLKCSLREQESPWEQCPEGDPSCNPAVLPESPHAPHGLHSDLADCRPRGWGWGRTTHGCPHPVAWTLLSSQASVTRALWSWSSNSLYARQ